MNIWRQLRWQILAAQLLVVVVGVVTLALAADALAAGSIEPPQLAGVRATLAQALWIAALAATVAGLAAGLLLTRAILRPLRELAQSSRRIAAGHYDERVLVPTSDELADVASSFNQMAAALAAVEQQRIDLIGNVAHELRTPLAGLEGYLEGVIDGVLPSEAETFTAMQHELRRLRRLVHDLQELSRVEAGQVSLQHERFDLVELVRRVMNQLQPQAPELDFHIDVPESLMIYADPDRTTQILVNLVGNAMRYTPEGEIRVHVHQANGQAFVEVSDTGIGIPPDALPYLFERFYRVDPSRARTSGGSGIGLTIARRLAWAQGGDLSATSAGVGRGSTFTLRLPVE